MTPLDFLRQGPPDGGNFEQNWAHTYLAAHVISDIGKRRERNEDSALLGGPQDIDLLDGCGYLFAVADGMGGHACGEVASGLAVSSIVDYYQRTEDLQPITWPYKVDSRSDVNRMITAVKLANLRIFETSCRDIRYKGMGTTIVAGLVAGGAHPSPVPHADVVTSTSHKTLRGPRAGFVVCREEHAKAIDKQVFPGLQGGPLEHVIAAKAVAFLEALQPDFKDYSGRVIANAQALAEGLTERGFKLVSGGTDNHLLLVDLRSKGITGKDGERALEHAGITVNKNTVPGEMRSPFVTSGMRIGTAALTTRGMGTEEMRTIGGWIADVLEDVDSAEIADRVARRIVELCAGFPLYAEIRREASATPAAVEG